MYALEMHRWSEAAALSLLSAKTAAILAYTYWAQAIGCARSGDNCAGANGYLSDIAAIHKDYVDQNKKTYAEAVEQDRKEASAWSFWRRQP